jgi:cytidine deaminase
MKDLDSVQRLALSEAAWLVRDRARVYGPTRVGCAALADNGQIYIGCNIEHRFRSHDIHAEVNAISSLVANGGSELRAMLIAAEREQFTPCGSCLDWIFEIGGGDCLVMSERSPGVTAHVYRARDLMPWYPI